MNKKAKRPYKKPGVFEVKLTPEDAVLSNCKVGSTGSTPFTAIPYKCSGGGCANAFGS
jgi:hypothetical protein